MTEQKKDMNPLTHTEPVVYPPGQDPVLDVPHDRTAAVDDFQRVLIYSMALAVVFILGAFLITS